LFVASDKELAAERICAGGQQRQPACISSRSATSTLISFRTVEVVGESDFGKRTLARLFLLLDRPISGEVLFEGRNAANLQGSERREFRCRIQPVFQNPYSRNPCMCVGAIITKPLLSTGSKLKSGAT
jgi:ABC-type microcin C transport system duplicated ATPase subunit YejF